MSLTLSCPNCGAGIDYDPGDDPVIRCPYCQSSVVVPRDLRQPEPAKKNTHLFGGLLQPDRIARMQEAARLAQQGDRPAAIKLYRDFFGGSTREAEEAVDWLAQHEPKASYSQAEIEALKGEIQHWLEEGNKIEAIQAYRQATRQGLKESREAVEAFEQSGDLPLPAVMDGEARLQQLSTAFQQAGSLVAVTELVQAGEQEAAVEAYQQAYGVSQDEARQAISKLARGLTTGSPGISIKTSRVSIPAEKAAVATAGVVGGISCLTVLSALVIFLLILVPVVFALASPGGPLEGVWNRVNPLAFGRVSLAFGEKGSGAGFFNDPRAAALDADNNLFVANYSDGKVQKFSADGEYQMLWNIGAEQYVSGMAVDRAGVVHLVYRGDIWKYDGKTGQALGKMADEPELWFEAISETPDGGIVAAANTVEILCFDQNGELVFSLADVSGAQVNEPETVADLAVDGVGNLYVLAQDDFVLVYSPEGRLLSRFGSSGDEPGQLRVPSAIAVDGLGRIYISDFKGIQVFSQDGRYLDKIEVEGFAHGLAIDGEGNLWAISNLPKVFKYEIQK